MVLHLHTTSNLLQGMLLDFGLCKCGQEALQSVITLTANEQTSHMQPCRRCSYNCTAASLHDISGSLKLPYSRHARPSPPRLRAPKALQPLDCAVAKTPCIDRTTTQSWPGSRQRALASCTRCTCQAPSRTLRLPVRPSAVQPRDKQGGPRGCPAGSPDPSRSPTSLPSPAPWRCP